MFKNIVCDYIHIQSFCFCYCLASLPCSLVLYNKSLGLVKYFYKMADFRPFAPIPRFVFRFANRFVFTLTPSTPSIHPHAHTRTHNTRTYTHRRTYSHTHTRIHIRTCSPACIHPHTYLHAHTYTHIHLRPHTCTHTHTHPHAYTRAHNRGRGGSKMHAPRKNTTLIYASRRFKNFWGKVAHRTDNRYSGDKFGANTSMMDLTYILTCILISD